MTGALAEQTVRVVAEDGQTWLTTRCYGDPEALIVVTAPLYPTKGRRAYVVTHRPTGRAVTSFPSLSIARSFVRALLESGVDWAAVTNENSKVLAGPVVVPLIRGFVYGYAVTGARGGSVEQDGGRDHG